MGRDDMNQSDFADQWSTATQPSANALAQTPIPSPTRDGQGRFLTGNIGGGRRNSRNKLTERFLDTIANDFAEHGAEAIAKVRIDDPATPTVLPTLRLADSLLRWRRMPRPHNSTLHCEAKAEPFWAVRRE
jgi:hypothetical protein